MNQSIVPAEWGPRGRGAEISYTIVDSPFGRMLVAVTARGICALSVHHSDAFQESELRRDFREAKVSRDDAAAGPAADAVLRYLGGETTRCEAALEVSGTPFQLSVWRELCAIPEGATKSYGEIAARIGRPSAARAVGHANGSNPVSILIPCHRAIGANGKLTGYRWGLETKKKLLAFEQTRAGRGVFHQQNHPG
ncbi:MAG TPA: methylated-DNA--[protein]-cysteine S-methyltransferase [Candidatus Binataceae bacterium]|jgi:AraC family transcriptional regulator, regulatory protein of adaptative response / methylated-DNA-[protein]-cysteine methyltransferase|nr:methylated-DNA--[protein]-cysteine S-methyltransferase [Candidatus Binataceae bacterium]